MYDLLGSLDILVIFVERQERYGEAVQKLGDGDAMGGSIGGWLIVDDQPRRRADQKAKGLCMSCSRPVAMTRKMKLSTRCHVHLAELRAYAARRWREKKQAAAPPNSEGSEK